MNRKLIKSQRKKSNHHSRENVYRNERIIGYYYKEEMKRMSANYKICKFFNILYQIKVLDSLDQHIYI